MNIRIIFLQHQSLQRVFSLLETHRRLISASSWFQAVASRGHLGSNVQCMCSELGGSGGENASDELIQKTSRLVSDHLSLFVHSSDLEVQERVRTVSD